MPAGNEREPLRACFFSHSALLEGAERSLLELVTELIADHGVLCTVVLPDDGPLRNKLEEAGASTHIINYSWWCDSNSIPDEQVYVRCLSSVRSVFKEIKQVLGKINPDVILTNTIVIPWGAVTAAFLGRPHVWFVREFGEADHNLKFFLTMGATLEAVNKLSACIVTNSDAVKEALFGDGNENKIQTVRPHISIPDASSPGEVGKYFTRMRSIKLIVAGAVKEAKGQKDAVLAVREIVRRGKDAELVIIGGIDAAYAEDLNTIISQGRLEANVRIIGFKDNPYPIMSQADIVLVCSRREAFGRVTVEGMLLRKPVIGTHAGGTPELIKDGFNGFLYQPGDFKHLADRIEYLADHPAKAVQMAENGFAFASSRFTREQFGGKVFALLKRLKQQADEHKPSAYPGLAGPGMLVALLTAAEANNPSISALVTELGSALADDDLRITSLEASLREKDSGVTKLEASLQEKNSRITGLEASLQEKDSRITGLEASLQEKDSRIIGLEAILQEKTTVIVSLEANLQEKISEIRGMQAHLQKIQQSIVMQCVNRYQVVIEKLLGRGTSLRGCYELGLSGIRTILNDGWRVFWHRSKSWFKMNGARRAAILGRPTYSAKLIAGYGQPVDIIVPVYNAFEWTSKCLSAVLAFTVEMPYRLIVVDDASTEERLLKYLAYLCSKHSHIHVLRNSKNIGFLQSANRGMKFSGNDVVLLNSDAVVTFDWLRKLRDCAYSNSSIATVTPLSNNATVCSVPKAWENNQIPVGYTVQEFGKLVEKAAHELDITCCEIPVGVGFCMYIKRPVISKIGLFSEDFGRGYQEEVDFCLRASEKGYRNVACLNAFVYHVGTASTSTEQAHDNDKKNFDLLLEKHPYYQHMWEGFAATSPLKDAQASICQSIEARSIESLRIGIDAQLLSRGNWTGSERHISGLIHALMKLDRQNSYTVFTAERSLNRFYYQDNKFVRKYALDSADILWDPDLADVDVFHRPFQCYSAKDLLLLLNARSSVISILDLINYHYPDYFPDSHRHRRYQKITKLSARFADRIIAISEHGKKDIVRYLQVPDDKISVVYPAVLDRSRFKKIEEISVIKDFKARYGLINPYILYVGTTFPHKNHEGLISAYGYMLSYSKCERNSLPDLVLIAPDTHLKRKKIIESATCKLKDKIHLLDYVPDEDMPLFYNCASLFAFPSLYEGFGLPLLEAMACDVPVVASYATSIPEVTGDAALLVDCTKPEQLAEAMNLALGDAGVRNGLIEKGRKRVELFTDADMAEKTLEIYRSAHQASPEGRSKLTEDTSVEIRELAREEDASIFISKLD